MNKVLKAVLWAVFLIVVIVGSSFTYSALKNAPAASPFPTSSGSASQPDLEADPASPSDTALPSDPNTALPSDAGVSSPSDSKSPSESAPPSASVSPPASPTASPSAPPSKEATPSTTHKPSASETASPSDTAGEEDKDDGRSAAPDFTVYNWKGNQVSLSDMKGKPVVINVWATWCPYCVKELPYFEKLYKEYSGSVSFMMVDATGTDQETPEKGRKFIEDNGYTFPVYFDNDSEVMENYGIAYYPTTIFVDANGKIVRIVKGAITEANLRTYIKEILE